MVIVVISCLLWKFSIWVNAQCMTHAHTHACTHEHTGTHACTHTHTHACTHTHTHTRMHTHTHTQTDTHTQTHTHISTHACHAYIYTLRRCTENSVYRAHTGICSKQLMYTQDVWGKTYSCIFLSSHTSLLHYANSWRTTGS